MNSINNLLVPNTKVSFYPSDVFYSKKDDRGYEFKISLVP